MGVAAAVVLSNFGSAVSCPFVYPGFFFGLVVSRDLFVITLARRIAFPTVSRYRGAERSYWVAREREKAPERSMSLEDTKDILLSYLGSPKLYLTTKCVCVCFVVATVGNMEGWSELGTHRYSSS